MSRKRVTSPRLIQLEAFVAAAERGSMVDAARTLGLDRSSVSRYITELEEWLSRPLTTGDVPLELTAFGRAFLPKAKEVIGIMTEARAKLS